MTSPGKRSVNLPPPPSIYDYLHPDDWHRVPEAEKFIAFLLSEVRKREMDVKEGPTHMNRFEILESVDRVLKVRQGTHGDAFAQFSLCARLVNAYFGTDFTPADMATINRFQKMSRDKIGGFHLDNTVDSIGYTAIEGEMRCLDAARELCNTVSDEEIKVMLAANTNAEIKPERYVDLNPSL